MIIPVFLVIWRRVTTMRKTSMVTDRELEIMKILWVRERASVREVQEDLNRAAGPVAYSTVQTLLNIMEEKKGLVRHVVEGRTFVYIPKKSSERTIGELTKRFVDRVFDGALDRVMVALLGSKSPTPEELDRLRAMIDEAQQQSFLKPGNVEKIATPET
jgi:BlaI family transcriptional regulator, penicillinase repressor